jgi:hypothetical protein
MNADVAQMNVPQAMPGIRGCDYWSRETHHGLVYVHLRYICVHLRSNAFASPQPR